MKAYKLFRLYKDGRISSLFIDKNRKLKLNTWLKACSVYTEGFKYNPGWHCVPRKFAPHLSLKNRVWGEVEIKDIKILNKPKSQGGKWFLAGKMKINKVLV